MNLRYALYNMDSAHPIALKEAQIRLHVQRNKTLVKRYYSIDGKGGSWKSPVFTSPYAAAATMFYDGDPLAEQRDAINAVIACVESEAWRKAEKPAPVAITDYCQMCQKPLAGFRRGTKFCSDACCRKAYRESRRVKAS